MANVTVERGPAVMPPVRTVGLELSRGETEALMLMVRLAAESGGLPYAVAMFGRSLQDKVHDALSDAAGPVGGTRAA